MTQVEAKRVCRGVEVQEKLLPRPLLGLGSLERPRHSGLAQLAGRGLRESSRREARPSPSPGVSTWPHVVLTATPGRKAASAPHEDGRQYPRPEPRGALRNEQYLQPEGKDDHGMSEKREPKPSRHLSAACSATRGTFSSNPEAAFEQEEEANRRYGREQGQLHDRHPLPAPVWGS